MPNKIQLNFSMPNSFKVFYFNFSIYNGTSFSHLFQAYDNSSRADSFGIYPYRGSKYFNITGPSRTHFPIIAPTCPKT